MNTTSTRSTHRSPPARTALETSGRRQPNILGTSAFNYKGQQRFDAALFDSFHGPHFLASDLNQHRAAELPHSQSWMPATTPYVLGRPGDRRGSEISVYNLFDSTAVSRFARQGHVCRTAGQGLLHGRPVSAAQSWLDCPMNSDS